MRKKLIAITAAMLGIASPATAAVEGPDIFWKLSMWGNPRALSAGMERLVEKVAEETHGKFRIKTSTVGNCPNRARTWMA